MHGRRSLLLLALALVAGLLTLPSAAGAADGDPDATFGGGDGAGFAQLDANANVFGAPLIAQAPDKSLVVAVVADQQINTRSTPPFGIQVMRLSSDGQTVTPLHTLDVDNPTLLALKVLSDGRIVLVYNVPNSSTATVMTRLLETGAPDPTVDADGSISDVVCNTTPVDAAIKDDGGFYVLSACGVHAFDPSYGTINAFGTAGKADIEPAGYAGILFVQDESEVVLGPGGKPHVLTGWQADFSDRAIEIGANHSAVIRYTTGGVHDTSFDTDGVRDEIPGPPYGMVVGADGDVVVLTDLPAARGGADYLLYRLEASGGDDDGWSGDGVLDVDSPAPFEHMTEMTMQPDGKLITAGIRQEQGRGVDASPQPAVEIARYTTAGALDPTFSGDGLQTLESADFPADLGPPVLQSDGKILVAVRWTGIVGSRFLVDAPNGRSVGVVRLNNGTTTTTTTTTTQQQQQQQQQAATATPAAAATIAPQVQSVALQRSCRSRRSFRIRLRTGRRKGEESAIVSSTITVNGKRVRAVRRGATVNLRNLPKGRFTVVIRLRLADGGTVRDVRRYRTCAQKIERELAPLRTRPPR